MSADQTAAPKLDILDRLKVYEEYGPLSSVAIHPDTPGYSTGRLLRDTRDARAEIERLRAEVESLRADLDGAAHNRFYDQAAAFFEGVESERRR